MCSGVQLQTYSNAFKVLQQKLYASASSRMEAPWYLCKRKYDLSKWNFRGFVPPDVKAFANDVRETLFIRTKNVLKNGIKKP